MLKKVITSLIVLSALCMPALAQGTKVAIVDADVIVQKSQKGKAFFEEFQKFTEGKRTEIEKMVEGFQAKQKDLQAKAASMSEDKKKESAMELQRLQTEIQRAQEDAKRESDLRLNTALERFRKEIAPLVRQVAIEKGIDMVLNNGPNTGLVYFSDAVNLTDAVIKAYDESQ
ncbi:OmpH family outer membrane protein [Acanthopleuribacter pedis]|uniref:OmpH family outer membrane protein n=1 Tax=Acanthopleuribacter pedis TaxID=442870 RepID=A0A8J7QAJ0_9BACT|nr:OmpH family outer membrane protein [Acanthopleuribacter pedis]MBO1320499.1 OmpH family outer membrane protein [Acanthopleuribacter pedis]